jgi:uncharacterized protein YacL
MRAAWFHVSVRAAFILLCAGLGMVIAWSFGGSTLTGVISGLIYGGLIVALELSLRNFTIRHFSHAVFGLLAGLLGAFLITRLGIFDLAAFRDPDINTFFGPGLKDSVEVILYTTMAFFGVMLGLRSQRDEFALIIPYVKFRRDGLEGEPLLLDTNVIIDGRLPSLHQSGFLSGTFVVPRSVLNELQTLADSRDELKSERGRRGLNILEALRQQRDLDLSIHEDAVNDGTPVDARLVSLARELNARLLTNDENLAQVARVRGTTVLSLNELARALQAAVQAGDVLDILMIKPGKEKHQAVGYLPDGAMVVVSQGAPKMGQTIRVRVTGTTQTTAGRLVFAEMAV